MNTKKSALEARIAAIIARINEAGITVDDRMASGDYCFASCDNYGGKAIAFWLNADATTSDALRAELLAAIEEEDDIVITDEYDEDRAMQDSCAGIDFVNCSQNAALVMADRASEVDEDELEEAIKEAEDLLNENGF